jgi:hypothetical protein
MAWRTIAGTVLGVALGMACAGCASSSSQPSQSPPEALWPGPDWKTPAPVPAAKPGGAVVSEVEEPAAGAAERDDSAVRVPKVRTRRGSGTPPDILFPNQENQTRTNTVQPGVPSTPVTPVDTGNPVLSPRDPTKPYSAQGYGYQREGTTVQGPNGTTYNVVGKTFFGTNGAACHAVGTSVFCN